MSNGRFMPKVTEQNDECIFELRDDVYISARFASEKKLRFQMWRQSKILPADEGNIFVQSFRDRLVAQARAGFNESGEPDAIPNIGEDIGLVSMILGNRGEDGKIVIPEPTRRPGGLARWRKLASGAVLVAAATGGTVIGYWWGPEPAERASPDPAAHAPKVVPGPPPEVAPWPPPNRDAPEADVPVPPP